MIVTARRGLPCQRWRCCLHSGSSRLFHGQPGHTPPKPAVDDVDMRWEICMAFHDTIKEWARVVPSDYISRPSSRPHLQHQNKHDDVSGYNEEQEEAKDDDIEDELEENISTDEDVSESDLDVRDKYGGVDVGDHDSRNENVENGMDEDLGQEERLDGVDDEYDNSHTYYITDSGKIKYRRLQILAPKDEIYQKLSEGGLVSPKFKRPLPVHKLINKPDADIIGWFYYCSIELLQYFRICHNLKEVKAIVEYHIRWSAIRTLAKKYRRTEREIVRKYGRDLECEDEKGNKVRLMSRQEIKQVSRGVNKRVQITHRFRALRILAEME